MEFYVQKKGFDIRSVEKNYESKRVENVRKLEF